ncbi:MULTISPECIES: hypothetical protein [unclassified Nocardiopsis]
MNVFADREEGGSVPPLPALSTLTGENWFSAGVYDIRNHIAPGSFPSHDWDIVWWQPSARWRQGLQQNHAWGYRFNRSLWEGASSAEQVFRTNLAQIVDVMNYITNSTAFSAGSQQQAVNRLNALNLFLTETTGISDGTDTGNGLFSLYQRVDEPEGGFQGNAAGMFAARIYDLAMRLTDMQIQLQTLQQGISDVRSGVVRAAVNFIQAYWTWRDSDLSRISGAITEWYNRTNRETPQWTTSFHPDGRYQMPLDELGNWGAPTLGSSDTYANDAVKRIWLDHLETLASAAETLYNAMSTTYTTVSSRTPPFFTPEGGLPPGFNPNPNIGNGNGNGNGDGNNGFDINDLFGEDGPFGGGDGPGPGGGSDFNTESLFGGGDGPGPGGGSEFNTDELFGGGPEGGGPEGGGSFDPNELLGGGPESTTVSDLTGGGGDGPGGGGSSFDPNELLGGGPEGGGPEGGLPEGSSFSDLTGGGEGGSGFLGGLIPPGGSAISGGGSGGGSRRLEVDPATGLPINPETGEPFPVNDDGVPYDPETGLPIALDPATGEVLPIDPMTGEPVPPGGSTISDLERDPATGLPINPETGEPFPVNDDGVPFNPETGLPIAFDPDTGELLGIDPLTGEPLQPGSGGSSITDRSDLSGGYDPPGLPDIPDLSGSSGGGSSFSDLGSGSSGPRSVDRSDLFALAQDGGDDLPMPQGGSSFNGSSLPGSGLPGSGLPGTGLPGTGTGIPGTGAVNIASGGGSGADPNGMGGMPMMPPPMMGGGMGGQGEGKEQRRATWLSEDERVWGTDVKGGKSAIGRPAPGENRKAVAHHDLTDTGTAGGRTGTSSADDPRLQRKKRKPGVGIRRSRVEGSSGDGQD